MGDSILISRSRWLTGPLCLFDAGLGSLAAFFPGVYMDWIQPAAHTDPSYLLRRTGTLWLCFALIEGCAYFRTSRFPEWVLLVAAMRLIDVPADLVYRFTDPSLNAFGKFDLLFAPAVNLTAGSLLAAWYVRWRKDNPTRVRAAASAKE